MELPKIPFMPWITRGVDWMSLNLEFLFEPVADLLNDGREGMTELLGLLPPLALIVVLCALVAWRRRYRLAVGAALSLALVWNLGFWEDSIITVSLAVMGGGLALVVGIPLGVLIAENRRAHAIVLPILDYMQATPRVRLSHPLGPVLRRRRRGRHRLDLRVVDAPGGPGDGGGAEGCRSSPGGGGERLRRES